MTKFIDCSNEAKAKEEKKETVFTHRLTGDNGYNVTGIKPYNYEKVIYLGKCNTDGDMFATYDGEYIEIFKGIKGSEFD